MRAVIRTAANNGSFLDDPIVAILGNVFVLTVYFLYPMLVGVV